MNIISTGEPATLGTYRKIALALGGNDSPAVKFFDEKIANSTNGETVFTMFKPDVQDAINVVGRAQFREYDGGNYNAIYPQQNNESQ